MKQKSFFNLFLETLQVPHTEEYSDAQYQAMPFKTLFGFSKLLQTYGIDSEALMFDDKSQLTSLPTPVIVRANNKFVIIKRIDTQSVDYETDTGFASMPLDEFEELWSGVALIAYPDAKSSEPDYRRHRNLEIANRMKKWVLAAAALFLLIYAYFAGGASRSWGASLLVLVDLAGLYTSFLLVLKSLNIKTDAGDKFCGVLQKGGCDEVLKMKASKFFGLFGWSEVGLSYFSVCLVTTLAFPQAWHWLALINACCLPFTFWSIWYQKFRAKHWCTMCVTVQCLLWCQFFCYLFGGLWRPVFPLGWGLFGLGAGFVAALFGLNALMPRLGTPAQPKN